MNKKDAIERIHRFLNAKRNNELYSCKYLLDELSDAVSYYLSPEETVNYIFHEFDHGFYLGNIVNGKKNGYGFYFWFPTDTANSDGALYMGNWRDGEMDGDYSFHFTSKGMCYYGSFNNGKYHCNRAHIINSEGIEIEAEFVNDKMTRVYSSNSSFSYKMIDGTSLSYDRETSTSHISSKDSDRKGCIGIFIIVVLGFFVFRMCHY